MLNITRIPIFADRDLLLRALQSVCQESCSTAENCPKNANLQRVVFERWTVGAGRCDAQPVPFLLVADVTSRDCTEDTSGDNEPISPCLWHGRGRLMNLVVLFLSHATD
jgi:hypothetical protein